MRSLVVALPFPASALAESPAPMRARPRRAAGAPAGIPALIGAGGTTSISRPITHGDPDVHVGQQFAPVTGISVA